MAISEEEVVKILAGIPLSGDSDKVVALHGTKGKPGYELMHPKGTVSSAVGSSIFSKYGQDAVEKMHGDAMKFYIAGQSVDNAVNSAAQTSQTQMVPLFIKGKPAGTYPAGTQVFTGVSFKNNPKDTPVAYIKVPSAGGTEGGEKWYTATAAGKLPVGPSSLPALNKAITAGTFVQAPYAYGEYEPHDPQAKKLGVPDSLDPNQPGLDAPNAPGSGGGTGTPDPNAPDANAPSTDPNQHTAQAPAAPPTSAADPVAHIAGDISSDEHLGKNPTGPDIQIYAKGEAIGTAPAGTKMYAPVGIAGGQEHNVPIVYAILPDGSAKAYSQKHPDGKDLGGQTTSMLKAYISSGKYNQIDQNTIVSPTSPTSTTFNPNGPNPDPNAPNVDANGKPQSGASGAPGVPGASGMPGNAPGGNAPGGPSSTPNTPPNIATPPANEETLPSGKDHGQPTLPNQDSNPFPGGTKSLLDQGAGASGPSGPDATAPGDGEQISSGKKFEVLDDPGLEKKPGSTGYFNGIQGLWGDWGSAGVMIHNKDEKGIDRYLLVQRGGGVSSNKGKWQLPGGALHSKENDYQAAARELTEEVGAPPAYLDTLNPVGETVFSHDSGWHYNNIAADSPTMFTPKTDGSETGDAKWVTKEEMASLDLHPALAKNMDSILAHYDKPSIVKVDDNGAKEFDAITPDDPGTDGSGAGTDLNAPDQNVDQQGNIPGTPIAGPPNEPEPSATTKKLFIAGKEVDDVPSDSKIYVSAKNAGNPKDAPWAYVKHADGYIDVYNDGGIKKEATDSLSKYINQDIDNGVAVEAQTYDTASFKEPDISSPANDPFGANDAKINVGGVDVTAQELADAVTKLKNGPSWQVKVHLKGHPLYNMDYVAMAKEENAKVGKILPTKEAVIKNMEDKLGKVPTTDAIQAMIKDDGNVPGGDPLPMQIPNKVNIGGVDVTKAELAEAIDMVSNGSSAYPKVNLKGNPLHKLDMGAVMKQENKKVTDATKDVLLKHLNKKYDSFHTDEVTGEEMGAPPTPTPHVTNPVMQAAQEASAALAKKLGNTSELPDWEKDLLGLNDSPNTNLEKGNNAPAIDNDIDAAGLKVKPGVYKKPGGYFANIEAKPDGTFYYTGSKKTGTVPITAKKFKSLHESGFQNYVGSPVEPEKPAIKITAMHEVTPSNTGGLPEGEYFTHDAGKKYSVFPDGTATLKDLYSGVVTPMDAQAVQNVVKAGFVHDNYGTTVIPPGSSPDSHVLYHVWGSSPLSKPLLEKMKSDIETQDGGIIQMMHNNYGVSSSTVMKYLGDNGITGGVKSAAIEQINNILHSSGTKQTPNPGKAEGLSINEDAPHVNNSVFEFDPHTGYAKPVNDQPASISDWSFGDMKKMISNISKQFGDGQVIGTEADSLTPMEAHTWLTSFFKGDMQGVYTVDAKHLLPENLTDHPGAPGNEATHKIIYAPKVKGELPAGIDVQKEKGSWPASSSGWADDDINEYLVKANAQNTDYLSAPMKQTWVHAHAKGDKTTVDFVSGLARTAADNPNMAPMAAKATWNGQKPLEDDGLPGAPDSPWKSVKDNSPWAWSLTQLKSYAKDYNLTTDGISSGDLIGKIEAHKAALQTPIKKGPDTHQLKIGGKIIGSVPGTHEVYGPSSEDDDEYLYTKSPDGQWTFHTSSTKQGIAVQPHLVHSIQNDINDGTIKKIDESNPSAAPGVPLVDDSPVYKITNQSGLSLGNNQQTTGVDDQHGNKYIFKPYSDSEYFRAESEHAANNIARQWGFKTAKSQLVEIDGKKGQLQDRHDALSDFSGMGTKDIAKLDQNKLNDLAKEHLLDWALDNPDGRSLNLLQLKNGGITGIDKGMFGKYGHTGQWDGLTPDESAHKHDPLVITQLWKGIDQGLYSQAQIDAMYSSVIRKAREMQAMDDSKFVPHLEEGLKNSPTYGEDTIKNFLKRKNSLVADMDTLWDRVYATTSYPKPEVPTSVVNKQGHELHSGFTAQHLQDVSLTKNFGTTAFFGGTDVEDMVAQTWRERRASDGKFNVRGELKARGAALDKVENYLAERAVQVGGYDPYSMPAEPPKPQVHPSDIKWYDTILKAAGNVAYHSDDKSYNQDKLNAMDTTKQDLNKLIEEVNSTEETDPVELHKLNAQADMAKLYLGYISDIESHKINGTKASKAAVVKYDYKPLEVKKAEVKPEAEQPKLKIEKMQATRAQNVKDDGTFLHTDDDGEITVGSNVLSANDGNSGQMYLVTLPTGETIEMRGSNTGIPTSSQGMIRYTIPNEEDAHLSMNRIQDQLRDMGLDLKPAEEQDFELYYWRHLANIMRERSDAKESGAANAKYKKFWTKVDKSKENKGGEAEIEMWRNAFAEITNRKQIDDFVAEGGHLPQFGHHDLKNPAQATGRPYWLRHDVSEADYSNLDMPAMQSGHDYGLSLVKTGGVFSTEGRLRHFGQWLNGGITMSSSTDQVRGSSSFIFTRLNIESSPGHTRVFLNPHVLGKTHNYAFNDDYYGKMEYKPSHSYYDFKDATSHTYSSNETLIKDNASLLDDIELVFFDDKNNHTEALKYLKDHGITEIRGVPIEKRIVHVGKTNGWEGTDKSLVMKAVKELKEWNKKLKEKKAGS